MAAECTYQQCLAKKALSSPNYGDIEIDSWVHVRAVHVQGPGPPERHARDPYG
jgi:hypothetical protein